MFIRDAKRLTNAQRRVAEALEKVEDGFIFVNGLPGTGKTVTITCFVIGAQWPTQSAYSGKMLNRTLTKEDNEYRKAFRRVAMINYGILTDIGNATSDTRHYSPSESCQATTGSSSVRIGSKGRQGKGRRGEGATQ